MYSLGVDIGASHIGLGLYDNKKQKLIDRKYIKFPNSYKFCAFLGTKILTKKYVQFLQKNIDVMIQGYQIDKIGIGCPGGVDPKRGLFYGSKLLRVGKIDFPFVFRKYQCPIYVENDGNCAAIGEALVSKETEFLMITVGTGVGFGLITKKDDAIFIAPDPTIWKILEINKVLEQKHQKYISSFKSLSHSYNTRKRKKYPRNQIFYDLENNQDIIDNYLENFKIGIEKINQRIPVKNICIGGSFSLYYEHYLKKLQKKLPNFHIFIASYYNDSGIVGAAQLPINRTKD